MTSKEWALNIVSNISKQANIPVPNVTFKVTGHTAGYFISKTYTVDFNAALLNVTGFEETIVHEVAHAVDWYRSGRRNRKSTNGRNLWHDAYWKSIMAELGYPNAKATHEYKTKAARVYRKFAYTCGCSKNHIVKTPTHNKIQKRGARYICNTCKESFGYKDFLNEIH